MGRRRDRDRRPDVMLRALADETLAAHERVLLVTLIHLPAEYVDGQRRCGSQGMDALGNFALHYDYLARALFTSSENVKKQLQRLVSKQVLSKRFPGTYGRPAGFQALTLRGDCQYRITFRPPVPPYSPPDPPLRGDRESPLPYRTPTPGAPAPTSGASPTLPGPGAGSEEEAADTDAAGRCAVDWWNREPPADDLDEPETGTDADRRRNQ